ncbi:winged helix-turn-helix domain-containing protein [Lysobacter niastensis]|uniref:Winged helix-turn-helix domain-containing protein n=1 Tax=Lysobacter niastensis TaxID=380629 RepID=A0ABS0BA84_9GAMM|nr:transcriptional regulator [Lysobacter niastensis]MBF6024060.1 winged helix-turn-helix domain-containing protein [Lysobacter niastensis]
MRLPIYRFGEFELDPASRELTRGGERVALPPKSFECLAYLIAHRDRAVGRDELISAVWGRVEVSDTVVAQTLLRARKALDDTGNKQQTIRTVPRFGYRWVASTQEVARDAEAEETIAADMAIGVPPAPVLVDEPSVEATAETALAAAAASAAGATAAPPRKRFARWLLWVLIFIGVIAAAAIWLWPRSVQTPSATTEDVVLVLPVEVTPAEGENAWVRLGAMDYVANRLRRSGLKVLPSDQTLHLSAQLGDAAEIDKSSLHSLQANSGARWIVLPQAVRDARGWRVSLRLQQADQQQVVEARGSTPLAAAASATDSWLSRLGRRSGDAEATPSALTERVQRIDAELLVGQIDAARRLIAAAPAEQRGEPALLLREGQVEFRAGRIDEAARIFGTITDRGTAVDAGVRAETLMGQGAVEIRRGNFPGAESRYTQALQIIEAEGGHPDDPALIGNAYNGRGVARVQQGWMEPAVRDMGMARIAMQRSGDLVEAAMVGTNLGKIEVLRGHYPQALQEFEHSIAVYERFGVQDYLAATLMSKGEAQLVLVQPAEALASIVRADAVAKALKEQDPFLAARIGSVKAEALLANGRLREAGQTLDALETREDLRDKPPMKELRLRFLLAQDARAPAAALARRHAQAGGDASGALALAAVQASLRSQDIVTARKLLLPAPAADPAANGDPAAISWELARALLAQAEGRSEEGLKFARSAMAIAERGGSPDDRVRAGVMQAMLLLQQGQRDAAAAVLGDLDAFAASDYRVAWVTLRLYRALGDPDMAAAALKRVEALRGERDIAVEPVL